jgi:hypothetical protein
LIKIGNIFGEIEIGDISLSIKLETYQHW